VLAALWLQSLRHGNGAGANLDTGCGNCEILSLRFRASADSGVGGCESGADVFDGEEAPLGDVCRFYLVELWQSSAPGGDVDGFSQVAPW
jgi:hypothetical protein